MFIFRFIRIYIFVYIYIYMYIYLYIYTNIVHVFFYLQLCPYITIYVYICLYMPIYAYIPLCLSLSLSLSLYIYIYMVIYVWAYTYICSYIYAHIYMWEVRGARKPETPHWGFQGGLHPGAGTLKPPLTQVRAPRIPPTPTQPKGASKGSKREARRDPSFKPRAWLETGEAKGAKRCRKGCPREPKTWHGSFELSCFLILTYEPRCENRLWTKDARKLYSILSWLQEGAGSGRSCHPWSTRSNLWPYPFAHPRQGRYWIVYLRTFRSKWLCRNDKLMAYTGLKHIIADWLTRNPKPRGGGVPGTPHLGFALSRTWGGFLVSRTWVQPTRNPPTGGGVLVPRTSHIYLYIYIFILKNNKNKQI